MNNIFIIKHLDLYQSFKQKLRQDKTLLCETNLKVGNMVRVVDNSEIYRAKILCLLKGSSTVGVLNHDTGAKKILKISCIGGLSDDLMKAPRFSVRCCIKYPFIKKSTNLLNFIGEIQEVPLYMEYDDKYPSVVLRRVTNGKNIFEEFLDKNTNATNIIHNEFSNNKDNEMKNKTKGSFTNHFEYVTLRNGDFYIVSYFKDFKNIYLCKAMEMNNSYVIHNSLIVLKTLKSKDRNIKINFDMGDIVKVFSPKYQELFRARVINIDGDDDFVVSYIDFGDTEVVKSTDIFELSDELKKKTKLPVRVSIDVPPNAMITEEILDIFTNLIANSTVLCLKYNTKSKNTLKNVILVDLETGNSVNNKIMAKISCN